MYKPVEFSRPRSVRNQHFKSAAHEHNLFHMHFKKIELEPAIIWKVATCQRITSKTLELSGSIPEPAIRSGDTGQQKHYFDSCQLIKTWMYNIRLQAPKLARKREIKHWYACGADGRKIGWSVYGHVIAEFSSMDRFSKLWGYELSLWSNKTWAENFKNYVISMDRKMSTRYSQVMMVSVYSSLTAVN